MSVKLASAETASNKSAVAAAVGTQNKITIAPFGVSRLKVTPLNWSNVSVGAVDTGRSNPLNLVSITSVYITDSSYNVLDDIAISNTGGYLKIIGSGFSPNCTVYAQGVPATSTTFVSSTEIRVQMPTLSIGNLQLYVVNSDYSAAVYSGGLLVSGFPVWTTGTYAAYNLTFSVQLLATGDSSLTYSLQAGSSLPSGISLSSTGVLSGTTTAGVYSFVVLINDSENQTTQQTISLTVNPVDLNFRYNALLLSGTGTNNSNNNIFLDSSNNNFTITRVGDVSQGTFSPFGLTGYSAYFTATSYITYDTTPITFTSTNSWTVEGYVNVTTLPNSTKFFTLLSSADQGSSLYWCLGVNDAGKAVIYWYDGNPKSAIGSTTLSLGVWYHLAFVSTGGVLKIFVNGTAEILTGTTTLTAPSGAAAYTTGAERASTAIGYISNIRAVSNTAVYSNDFVPSTSPVSVYTSNTSLLALQSNRFIDNNTQATPKTISATLGSIQPYAPYSPTAAYSTNVQGGSAYFDGTGDYLTVPDSANLELGSGDFCIEMMFYTPTVSGTAVLLDKRSASYGPILIWRSSAILQLYMSTNGTSWAINAQTILNAINPNQWYHISVYRISGILYTSVNGVITTVGALAGTLADNATNYYIGMGTNVANPWTGYITGLKINIGSSPYTSSSAPFPTAPLSRDVNTRLLMNFSNAGVIDGSGKNSIQTVGDVKISTTQSKFDNSSIVFDGTGDYLTIPDSPIMKLGSQNFTIEGWIYIANGSSWMVAGKNNEWALYGDTNRWAYKVGAWSGGTQVILTAWTPTLNTWYHVACVRNSTNTTIYINGTSIVSNASVNITDSTGLVYVGGNGPSSVALNGYIDDLRISNGIARYTANFTAPIAPLQLQ